MAKEMKFRPATMAEIEDRDTDLYMNGERVWVFMIHRSGSIGEEEHKLDYITLTNMKKVQPEDLQVIDDTPEDGETKETTSKTNQTSETMAKTMTAQDYVGKTVSIKGSDAKYVIKSVDGDKLMTDFYRAKDAQPMPCPMPWATLEAKLKEGVYIVEGATATATDEVEEVEEIVVEPAKTVKMERETKKKSDKPKQENVEEVASEKRERSGKSKAKGEAPKADGKLRYETYTNKRGKVCAKIIGFGENDPAYVNAADLHGSATYERDKDGGKTFYLIFGPRYADAAKEVCKALNDGKALKDCKAIVDAATEERARQRDEWKQKREERKAKADEPKGKTYTEAEVADLIKRVIAGDKEAMEIVNAMSKAA